VYFKANGGGLDISLKELAIGVAVVLGVGNGIGLYRVDDKDRFTASQSELLDQKIEHIMKDLEAHKKLKWHGNVGSDLSEMREKIQSMRREHTWMTGKELEQ